ncbi:MAG: serine/threonine-protein kinase, partial [Methanobacteriota archaeon]
VLAALETAHGAGIVHRDVKPGNILLTQDGRAKLADFGIARGPAGAKTAATKSGLDGAGTLAYMAPEQVRGRPADARTDLYALGAVLYQMLTGRTYLAFDRLTSFDARIAILEDAPALPIAGGPEPVNALLARLLAKDPAQRPASAAEALSSIGVIL